VTADRVYVLSENGLHPLELPDPSLRLERLSK
jgi:hypothetical protein